MGEARLYRRAGAGSEKMMIRVMRTKFRPQKLTERARCRSVAIGIRIPLEIS